MAENEGTGTRRPNRNVIWLIGLTIVALLIGALALNSRMSEGESAGHDYTSTQGSRPPVGQATTGGGGG